MYLSPLSAFFHLFVSVTLFRTCFSRIKRFICARTIFPLYQNSALTDLGAQCSLERYGVHEYYVFRTIRLAGGEVGNEVLKWSSRKGVIHPAKDNPAPLLHHLTSALCQRKSHKKSLFVPFYCPTVRYATGEAVLSQIHLCTHHFECPITGKTRRSVKTYELSSGEDYCYYPQIGWKDAMDSTCQ